MINEIEKSSDIFTSRVFQTLKLKNLVEKISVGDQWEGQSVDQSIDHSVSKTDRQSASQLIDRSISQLINELIKQSVTQ